VATQALLEIVQREQQDAQVDIRFISATNRDPRFGDPLSQDGADGPMQATHFAFPVSSVSIRCVPRHRGESAHFTSGYCSVFLCGFIMCLKVSAIPLSIART